MCMFFPNPDQFSFLLPRSIASLACYRRLKQRQVLPSVGPNGSKVYEQRASPDPVFTDRVAR